MRSHDEICRSPGQALVCSALFVATLMAGACHGTSVPVETVTADPSEMSSTTTTPTDGATGATSTDVPTTGPVSTSGDTSTGETGSSSTDDSSSDADDSPLSHFSFAPGRLVMPNGVMVAEDLAALITDGPGDGITITEQGDNIIKAYVWTNTAVTGERFSKTDHCDGWTSADKLSGARQGRNAEPKIPPEPWTTWKLEKRWASYSTVLCALKARLYCIEDEP